MEVPHRFRAFRRIEDLLFGKIRNSIEDCVIGRIPNADLKLAFQISAIPSFWLEKKHHLKEKISKFQFDTISNDALQKNLHKAICAYQKWSTHPISSLKII